MKYNKSIILKNGWDCHLRNTTSDDAEHVLETFNKVHNETDFLLYYQGEKELSIGEEKELLASKENSSCEILICSLINDKIKGLAGVSAIGSKEKIKYRATLGVSIEKEYWGQGIGRALTEACIDCAKTAGYKQLELEVVAENRTAIKLYESVGFIEYGRNPRGFHSRYTGWQELVLMRLPLD